MLFYTYGVLLLPMERDLGWRRSVLTGAFSSALARTIARERPSLFPAVPALLSALVDEGVIAPDDLKLFRFCETANEAWDYVVRYYERHPAPERTRSGAPE